MNLNRQPAGVPTGGQFASDARSRSTVSLADGSDIETGTIRIVSEPARLVRERKALHAELEACGYEEMHPLHGVVNFAERLYEGQIATARDDDGRITGMICFENRKSSRAVHMHQVRVAHEYTGRGIGADLVRAVREADPTKETRVYGMVEDAREFYAKTGADMRDGSSIGEWEPLEPATPQPRR